ncbi:Fe3+ hydroxamate ABC transporter substrate-binding protein [Pontibacillus salipaludis]|uniref:Fe3+ hydroxamate ABC transporter substrate-binding protein n=1 Tax=Pontibacillus salipaludis TaxID=1697394 RepID=A0ABQ1QKD6_9BACI|nr:Fe3+ hydroxamate ABC transporter substrate-binding protein [Pontibacillus salipaludis]GGD29073.1 hypothetical protein GCM10011389_40790 [Pontibacillus salipaludis]
MFFKKKTIQCSSCNKEIQGGDEFYLRMRYPYYEGSVRIKKFIEVEGVATCLECVKKSSS